MEDNFTNKKTVDQAWNTMKGILDKEMPVVVKSRRFPYSTCLIGGALLIGLSCVLYFSLSPSTSIQEEKTRPVHSEASKQIANNETTNQNTKEIKSDRNNAISKLKESTEKNQIESIQANANSNKSIQVKPSNSSKSIVSATNITISDSKTTSNISSTNIDAHITSSSIEIENSKPLSFEEESIMKNVFSNSDASNIATTNNDSANTETADSDGEIAEHSIGKESHIDVQKIVPADKSGNDMGLSEEPLIANARTRFVSAPNLELLPSYARLTKNIKYLNTKIYNDIPRIKYVEWTVNLYGTQRVGGVRPIIDISGLGTSAALEVLLSNRINDKWKIGTGLGYKRSGRTVSFSFASNALGGGFDASFVSADELEIRDVDNAFNTGTVVASTAFLVRGTQFISLPIFATRKLGARWATDIGVRYNQKIGDFGSIFFEDSRTSNVDVFLTPTYRLSRNWSLGMILQYSTNQFDHTNTIISKELGKIQLGLSARYRI